MLPLGGHNADASKPDGADPEGVEACERRIILIEIIITRFLAVHDFTTTLIMFGEWRGCNMPAQT